MTRHRQRASATVGLAAALLWTAAPVTAQAPPGRPGGFPEATARIDRLLLHYDPDMAFEMFPIYRDLARGLAPDVRITLAVGRSYQVDGALFVLQSAGFDRQRIDPVVVHGNLTVWSRDRTVVVGRDNTYLLLTPQEREVAADRHDDLLVSTALAGASPGLRHEAAGLSFEGGNILFSGSRVLVGSDVVRDNLESRTGEVETRAAISAIFGRELLVLGGDDPPHNHLDMFLTVVDENTVLLGDPNAGLDYLRRLGELGLVSAVLPDIDCWNDAAQTGKLDGYQQVLRALTDHGFRVERIPILHGTGGGVISWNNALVERRTEGRRAYVPVYGVPELDRRALTAYRSVGCEVFPIDVSRMAKHGGTVRCVTNVLAWREPRSADAPAVPGSR